jgi:hypothetical protein
MDAVNTPDEHRLSLGAYVLGALDTTERADLEAHLTSCPSCQEELVRLAGLPGLLRQLSLDEALSAAPSHRYGDHDHHDDDHAHEDDDRDEVDTDALAERALLGLRYGTATGRNRRSRRSIALASAAAAVLVISLITGSVATGLIGEWGNSVTVTATDPQTRVHASVRMKQETGGTELVLTLSGVPENQRCLLVAVGRNGLRETAATWMASYQGTAKLEGYTSITPDAMGSLEIVTPDGEPLLRLPV